MPYATGRVYFDADSHVMEPADWLNQFADPDIRTAAEAGPAAGTSLARRRRISSRSVPPTRRSTPARRSGSSPRASARTAPGMPTERSRRRSTCSASRRSSSSTPSRSAASSAATTPIPLRRRAGAKPRSRRLLPARQAPLAVGYLPMRDPETLRQPRGRVDQNRLQGPTRRHQLRRNFADPRRLRPRLGALAEASVPFMTHIGTGGPLVPKAYRNNGRPVPKDWLGGGENIRSKDYLGIGYWPYTFLSMMALDGVFERFPALRGASIEQGAEWVPMLLRGLDHAQNLFTKSEPDLQALPMQRLRLHPPSGEVHALPEGGRPLGHRRCRARPAHVLDRLPASRGRPRPAEELLDRTLPAYPTKCSTVLLRNFAELMGINVAALRNGGRLMTVAASAGCAHEQGGPARPVAGRGGRHRRRARDRRDHDGRPRRAGRRLEGAAVPALRQRRRGARRPLPARDQPPRRTQSSAPLATVAQSGGHACAPPSMRTSTSSRSAASLLGALSNPGAGIAFARRSGRARGVEFVADLLVRPFGITGRSQCRVHVSSPHSPVHSIAGPTATVAGSASNPPPPPSSSPA